MKTVVDLVAECLKLCRGSNGGKAKELAFPNLPRNAKG